MNRVGESNTAIDRVQAGVAVFESAYDDGAGTAVAFGAAFLGAFEIEILADQLKQSAICGNILDLNNRISFVKPEDLSCHGLILKASRRLKILQISWE